MKDVRLSYLEISLIYCPKYYKLTFFKFSGWLTVTNYKLLLTDNYRSIIYNAQKKVSDYVIKCSWPFSAIKLWVSLSIDSWRNHQICKLIDLSLNFSLVKSLHGLAKLPISPSRNKLVVWNFTTRKLNSCFIQILAFEKARLYMWNTIYSLAVGLFTMAYQSANIAMIEQRIVPAITLICE